METINHQDWMQECSFVSQTFFGSSKLSILDHLDSQTQEDKTPNYSDQVTLSGVYNLTL